MASNLGRSIAIHTEVYWLFASALSDECEDSILTQAMTGSYLTPRSRVLLIS